MSAELALKLTMFAGVALVIVLLARGSRPNRPDRRHRDRFFARLADHGQPKGGPYIPFPPNDYSNSG